jgi:hypothetical protein
MNLPCRAWMGTEVYPSGNLLSVDPSMVNPTCLSSTNAMHPFQIEQLYRSILLINRPPIYIPERKCCDPPTQTALPLPQDLRKCSSGKLKPPHSRASLNPHQHPHYRLQQPNKLSGLLTIMSNVSMSLSGSSHSVFSPYCDIHCRPNLVRQRKGAAERRLEGIGGRALVMVVWTKA